MLGAESILGIISFVLAVAAVLVQLRAARQQLLQAQNNNADLRHLIQLVHHIVHKL